MAKRDILKEAIADAKAVKETAIANAKAALEEAFTPQLKSMLAAKLEEMELDEEKEDDMKEGHMGMYDEDDMKEGMHSKSEEDDMKEGMHDKSEEDDMKEGMHDKAEEDDSMEEGYHDASEEDDVKEGKHEEIDEELNLDEILAELESELNEEKDKEMKKEEISEAAHEEMEMDSEEEEVEMDSESEEIDLEDMTDDDLKDFIEDVIADMIKSGELEAGDNFEEEDVEVEDKVDVDVDVMEGKHDEMDEVMTSRADQGAAAGVAELAKMVKRLAAKAKGLPAAIRQKVDDLVGDLEPASPLQKKLRDAGTGRMQGFQSRFESLEKEVNLVLELQEAQAKVEELEAAIDVKDKALNEVNLLNAKLLYTNKIFRAKTLTESQKVKVLGAFDKANTVKETKLVFETLNEGLKTKKTTIKESLGSASKSTGNFKTNKKPIVETDPMVARFQKLAGIK